ncbi:MAG: hypothetical protein IJZ95_06070 [Oscillospiraceae bacterium]|nr:hypothetical protein [Oscillospiraceae bacterium]
MRLTRTPPQKRLVIDTVDEDADVYIRVVEPSVIEYAVADGVDALQNENYICAPKKVDLAI